MKANGRQRNYSLRQRVEEACSFGAKLDGDFLWMSYYVPKWNKGWYDIKSKIPTDNPLEC